MPQSAADSQPPAPLRRAAWRRRHRAAQVDLVRGGEQGEAGQGRESRARYALRAGPACARPADPDRAAEHALRIIGDALQLGAAAGQHHLAAERRRRSRDPSAPRRSAPVRCSSRWRITAISWARVMRAASIPSCRRRSAPARSCRDCRAGVVIAEP